MVTKKKLQTGFTLIELMIVVAIIGILAATVMPFLQDYTTRSKMVEVVNFAREAKTAVSECILSEGDITLCGSNPEVGLSATATDITSTYVESVSVAVGGVITVAIQGTNNTDLDGATLGMTPNYVASSGVSWNCLISDINLNKYMPPDCRQ